MSFVSSMTGFGKGESSNEDIRFTVEIKTINNRYNDINIKIPKFIRGFEENVRKIAKNKISRGRIDMLVTYEVLTGSDTKIKVNKPIAIAYKKAIDELSGLLGLKGEPDLDTLLKMQDILEIQKTEGDSDKNWMTLEKALNQAMDELISMRKVEGEALSKDILNSINQVEILIDEINDSTQTVVEEYKEKLEKRVSELIGNKYNLDESKLYNEIVFFADKSDINEELVRLKSHLKQLGDTLAEGGVIGRKLDFILQEINRESNTIGSKSSTIKITQGSVEIKNHIEKMREQVQNIE
ncbi:MAG: Protein YicC [Clostridiales bacterium 38_11]|nr:MAG: Protein YicC [Clostridiales bacterium 38_11]HBH12152.1 YicC family protein [Clostridiales bacterium]